ncbi:hypothetical protein LTR62_004679 [Meristemomyces frigidus]|uniref:Uncharacterized protein n=1 Tax=Meristemomyces frigidus TaxID=1508187 RepID=A0AAN7TE93_9PEZI|nr:hypothetical protein LTR62_004679 [Meristemomyces frigidus]
MHTANADRVSVPDEEIPYPMQLSGGVRRRQAAPTFTNKTPKSFEMTPCSPSPSPVMFAPAGTAVAAGPLYTNVIMGQSTSTLAPNQHERCHKFGHKAPLSPANSAIVREEAVDQTEELRCDFSRPDSWSLRCADTTQAPYSTPESDKMMTSTSLLPSLRNKAESADLAEWLKTTGPCAPHRRPSKLQSKKRGITAPAKALRYFRRGNKRARELAAQTNLVLHDEGGLLLPPPLEGVEQRQTSSGRKYLALQVKIPEDALHTGEEKEDVAPNDIHHQTAHDALEKLSPVSPVSSIGHNLEVVDSRVSISFPDELRSSEIYDDYWLAFNDKSSRWPSPIEIPRKSSAHLPLEQASTVRVVNNFSSPIRPRAKTPAPPTPQPGSAISIADSYRSDLAEHPAVQPLEPNHALGSHPVQQLVEVLTSLPKISLPNEEFPVKHPALGKEVEIKHPSPRRFASHPVLLQRASSIASSLYPRSFSDSPGPPPPRSPLRQRQDPRTIESIIAAHTSTQTQVQQGTPKVAPTIDVVPDYNEILDAFKPCVVTECTGPIKRQRSRNKDSVIRRAHPMSLKEREERIRNRKIRDRSDPGRTADTVALASKHVPPRRLRKARPHINIPDLHPAPLVTRTSSSTSSSASWKKISDCTRSPVSPVPSQASGEKTGYTPVSPTASNESAMIRASMALSPVMLVAESVPLPKSRQTPKPARLIVKESKTYSARPRSASIPRNALKRRSHFASGTQTPVDQDPGPPSHKRRNDKDDDDTPPLPSPPPTRALPPTPPASGSERPTKLPRSKDLPTLPIYEILPCNNKPLSPPKRLEHVANQAQVRRKSTSSKESTCSSSAGNGNGNKKGVSPHSSPTSSRVDARLAALEKQNAMLSAALMAVLRTNGALNSPLTATTAGAVELESPPGKQLLTWETRVKRRSEGFRSRSEGLQSEGGHRMGSSREGSEGSALEMYMSTRRGSGHGCGGA